MLFPVVGRCSNHFGTFFELAVVENLRVQLETNKFVVLLLKFVGAFYPQAQHVCVKIEAQVKLYQSPMMYY